MARKIPITVRLPESDLIFAEEKAQDLGMSRSQLVARILRDFRKSQGDSSNDSD